MKALTLTVDNPLVNLIRGLAEYKSHDQQVNLAQQVLYGLGIATAENIPSIEAGESLFDYLERLDPQDLATIEGLGIGQGRQLEEYLRAATRLILYDQYVTGRWEEYAIRLGVDDWSPYVSHLLDDCLRMSESEGRRWAVAIEVVQRLYAPEARAKYGLVFIGDPVLDHDTGEVVADATRGLPATAGDVLREHFNRYSREAGVRLRDLFREVNELPFSSWMLIKEYRDKGYFTDPVLAEQEKGWNEQEFEDYRTLYVKLEEIRRILDLAASPALDDKQVNRQATQGKSLLPHIILPPDFDPVWTSFLTNQFPDAVSATGSLTMGQRYVQVRLIKWPKCECGEPFAFYLYHTVCQECNNEHIDRRRYTSIWETRVANENGVYPEEWTWGPKPTDWLRTAPEVMDIHGLNVSVWETTVMLEELDES